jgi:hypothetical protein
MVKNHCAGEGQQQFSSQSVSQSVTQSVSEVSYGDLCS